MNRKFKITSMCLALLVLTPSVFLAQTTTTTAPTTGTTSTTESKTATDEKKDEKKEETTPAVEEPTVGVSQPETEPSLPPKTPPTAGSTPAATASSPSTLPPSVTPTPVTAGQADLMGPGLQLPESVPNLDALISLDLRDIDVLDILKFLAIKAGINIVGGQGITGKVNILLNEVNVRDAIEIILSVNRLAYSIEGNIMRVMTEEEFKALYGKEFYDKRETKVIRLKYASAKNVGAILENTKSSVGRIIYNEATGTVVMTDTPEKIKAMEEIIAHEEIPTLVRLHPTQTKVYDIQYALAEDIHKEIETALTKDIGKAYVDKRSNRLVVSDLSHKLAEIDDLVVAFDVKTREVFIEAKIVQVSLRDQFESGIDWASVTSGHFQQTFGINANSFGQMTIGTIAPQTVTDANGIATTSFSGAGIIMKFLETFGDVNILSTPQIAAIDGQEARIMVGTKEAYTTSSITQSQATTTTSQEVTFVDVGVNLKVTPKINTDGYITMKISPEVSSVNRFLTTAQGDQIPIVETTNAETTVMVKDGSTVLIGGLMATQRRKTRTGIPLLSRLPILGIAFRSTNNSAINTELSVLLTPHIMSGETALPGTTGGAASAVEVTLPPGGELPGPQ